MRFTSIVTAAIASLAFATPVLASQTPNPHVATTAGITRVPGFSSKVHIPSMVTNFAPSACNRRVLDGTYALGSLGPSGASTSQALVVVPLRGGSIASATTQQQLSDICAR